MKKILIIIPSIKKWGWAEKVAVTIWDELFKKWYKIYYFTFYSDENNLPFKWIFFTINEKISKNIFLNFLKLFIRAYKISKFCKKNNIDTCISHLDEANFSNIISKIIFKNKSKIIIEIHNSIEKSLSNLYLYIYKLLINFSNKVISLTKEDLLNYENYFKVNKDKLINIYNPIDINKINILKNENIDDLNIKEDSFILINIWRLNEQKNQKLLITSFCEFNYIIKNSKLLILWEWELRKELEKEIKNSNNKNIILLWIKENPYKYLKKANYLVMSSNYEWLPVVEIESLACNTPIISSDCKTWPKEIININNDNFDRENKIIIWDCWILYPIWDSNKLKESIMLAYNNNNNINKKFIDNSKEKIKEFNIENIIKLREKIINE